jgi:hypothetical protein
MTPTNGQVIRGVSFTPGTGAQPATGTPEVPWTPLIPLSAALVAGAVVYWRRRVRHASPASSATTPPV